MTNSTHRAAWLLAFTLGLAPSGASGPSPIRQLDHVVISTADPRPLFSLLADTLGLPVAWPVSLFGDYQSGAVSVGNLNIEVGRARPRPTDPASVARFTSIVFEPAPLAEAVATLDARGIAHAKPFSFGTERGASPDAPAWTTVTVSALSAAGLGIVLCEYYRPSVRDFRRAMTDSLRARAGGQLGVVAGRELWLGTGGDSTLVATWIRLLSPHDRHEPNERWTLGAGPDVHLDASSPRGTARLLLGVKSLAAAEAFLRSHGLFGALEGQQLRLDPRRLGGLDLRLVEMPAR